MHRHNDSLMWSNTSVILIAKGMTLENSGERKKNVKRALYVGLLNDFFFEKDHLQKDKA